MQLSINEAANFENISRQAIYVAIREGRINAQKNGGRWIISWDNLHEYRRHRYDRTKSKFNNQLIFDKEKGLYSATEAAYLLDRPVQHVYYACRDGKIKFQKTGHKDSIWVIHIDDIKDYKMRLPKLRKIRCDKRIIHGI